MPVVLVVPVAAVVVAIVAILLLLAAPAVARLLHSIFDGIPLVGGYLATAVDATVTTLSQALESWAQEAALAMARPIYATVMLLWNLGNNTVGALGSLYGAIARVAANVRAELHAAEGALQANINATWNAAGSWVAGAEATAAAEVAALGSTLGADLSNSVAALDGAIADTAANLQANINQAAATASGLFDTAMGAVGALDAKVAGEVSAAESAAAATAGALAAAAATGAIGALDQAAHDVVTGPWEALLPEVGTIVEHLPATVAQAIPGLESLPRDLPVSVAGILAALAPTIAGVATETARCTVPMCENLGGLSNLFAGLRDAAFLGLLVALMEEAVHNPGGFAATVQEDLYGPAKAAYDAARDLVGV